MFNCLIFIDPVGLSFFPEDGLIFREHFFKGNVLWIIAKSTIKQTMDKDWKMLMAMPAMDFFLIFGSFFVGFDFKFSKIAVLV